MENGGIRRQSKFNSTVSILIRLDRLWQDTHRHSRNGELIKWNWDLDRVWCELVSDVSEEDIKEFDKFTDKISECNMGKRTLDKKKKGFGFELYQILMSKERFLRILQNKQGKGVSYIDEDEDDFD